MSETDIQKMESDGDVSTTSTDASDSSIETVSESETEEEKMDPCKPLIDEAMHRNDMAFEEMKQNFIDRGFDDQSVKDKAFANILPDVQKELKSIYMDDRSSLVDETTKERSSAWKNNTNKGWACEKRCL